MAYRAPQHSQLCGECRAPTELACRRCGGPLCLEHLPTADRRCDVCEAEYIGIELHKVKTAVVYMVTVVVGLGVVGAFLTHMARNGLLDRGTAPIAPLMPSTAALLLFAVFGTPPLIRWVVRRQFLGEIRHARQVEQAQQVERHR